MVQSSTRDFDDYVCYELHKNISNELMDGIENYISTIVFESKHTPYHLVKNKFPYKEFDYHYLCWINPMYASFYDKDRVEKIFKETTILDGYKESSNTKIWINEIHIRSVFSVDHYHIGITKT